MVALCFPRSRDGPLARYRVLRQSFASVCFLPLATFRSELQGLAMERALICALKPAGNGACFKTGQALRGLAAALESGSPEASTSSAGHSFSKKVGVARTPLCSASQEEF